MNEREGFSAFPGRTALLLTACLFILASCVAFGASVSYGFLHFDDSYVVVNNLAIRGPTPSNIRTVFTTYDPELYIPLTLMSYQFNWMIAGLQPGIYHLTNIVLHGLNAFLFSGIVWMILGRKSVAVFFGLIFAVHPLNTEAAVWVSARKDVLSTFFLLSSILLYLRFVETSKRRTWLFSIALFVLAALSKSSVMMLPLLLPLLYTLKEGRGPGVQKTVRDLWPFFLIAVVTGVVALLGKTRVVGGLGIVESMLLAIKSSAFYLQKIIVPTNLSAIYPQTGDIAFSSPDIVVSAAVMTVLITVCIAIYKKTSWPLLCLGLFCISIAPSFLNAHKGTQTFFAVDRYAYVGMLWILLLVAALSTEVTDRLTKRQSQALGSILLLVLAYMSRAQTTLWAHDTTILSHALSLYPASVSARTGLAAEYYLSGQIDKELFVLQEGKKYADDIALDLGIGSVYARQGRIDEAEALYIKSMAADPKNPEPHFYLAALREQQGRPDDAAIEYAKAIALDHSYAAAYNNLGSIAMDTGDYAEAEKQFKAALSLNPNFFEGQYNLFQVLEFQKKREEAFSHLEMAYQLRNDIPEASLSYGYRLYERGREAEAIRVVKRVLEFDPANRTASRLLQLLMPDAKAVEETNAENLRLEERRMKRTKTGS